MNVRYRSAILLDKAARQVRVMFRFLFLAGALGNTNMAPCIFKFVSR